MFRFLRLTKRCSDLEDRVQRLESGQKAMELEWESVYDSLRRLAGKIARRAQHDAAAAATAESDSTPRPGAPGADHQGVLNLDPMSARIRAARHSTREA